MCYLNSTLYCFYFFIFNKQHNTCTAFSLRIIVLKGHCYDIESYRIIQIRNTIHFLAVKKNTIIKHSLSRKSVMYTLFVYLNSSFCIISLTGTKSCRFAWLKTPEQNTGKDESLVGGHQAVIQEVQTLQMTFCRAPLPF